MKKILLFLTILVLIFSVSGCSKKESETKPGTGADMPEKNTDCTFKAVVTEVNDAGMVVKPVPGTSSIRICPSARSAVSIYFTTVSLPTSM
ncbi:MAG: hypothetical protein K6G24_09305 [Lachnospiraceae bacterium]|nr:hypothetical protein [Lachnospiraceae bacterium]